MRQIQKAVQIDEVGTDRSFTVVASDETVDRYGDIVRADGWELKNFKKNPIALFGHDHQQPIGTVPKVWVEGKQLLAEMQLAPEGVDPFIDKLWKLVSAGILRAVSVGFMPTVEPTFIRDAENDRIVGFDYHGQELLELSLVTVPANPTALSVARSFCGEDDVSRFFADPAALRRRVQQQLNIDLALCGNRHG